MCNKKARLVICVLGIAALIMIVAIVVTIFKLKEPEQPSVVERETYSSIVEKWRDGNGEDGSGDDGVLLIKEILKAADNKDTSAIKAMFTKEMQNDSQLAVQLEEFFDEYPGNLSECRVNDGGKNIESTYENGKEIEFFEGNFTVRDGNAYYFITVGACCMDDYNNDAIGLEYFVIESEKAYVLKKERDESKYIYANIEVEDDFEVRWIGRHPYKFIEIERNISQEQVLETLKLDNSIDNFKELYGEPNSISYYDNYFYELEEIDGEKRYVEISFGDDGYIQQVSFIGDRGSNNLYYSFDEDGNILDYYGNIVEFD